MCKKFTLIELLVVIAIIAILAAMLLPALRLAREQGKSISCVNNQKQVYSALMFYTNDWDGFLPSLWGSAVEPNDQWQDVAAEYIKNEKVFACPCDDKFDFTYAKVSYGYDGRNNLGFGSALKDSRRVIGFNSPASKMLYADSKSISHLNLAGSFGSFYGFQVKPGDYQWYLMGSPHNKGANITWLDGHVSWGAYGSLKTSN